jgi:GDP-4-dehydro-6-deoxy-D-mannose reductase
VTKKAAVSSLVKSVLPDVVYHFAGRAFVVDSYRNPALTYRVNVMGTLHLLEAIRRSSPATRFAFAGSGTAYGTPDIVPTPEESPLRPGSPYASSKAAADMLCLQYFLGHGLKVYRYRIFGITGVGKEGDVCNDFAGRVARLEREESRGPMRVGALDLRRDKADVHDAVRAMELIVERGEPGGAYNIGSGGTVSVREILDSLLHMARREIRVVVDPKLFRAVDEPVHQADIGKLSALGWRAEIPMEDTLRGILEHWRAKATPLGTETSAAPYAIPST